MPTSIQTIGDLIQIKRHEKNLTAGHLALKMGIATALVLSWENGTIQPNSQQLTGLAKLLEFDTELIQQSRKLDRVVEARHDNEELTTLPPLIT